MKPSITHDHGPIPVNQPSNFPRLYFIRRTKQLQNRRRGANDPRYQQPILPAIHTPRETIVGNFIRQEKEIIRDFTSNLWSATKAWCETAIKWIFWRVILPLSVVCAFWIPAGSPAELPL